MAKPFIKWAGGKRKLIPSILSILPKSFNSYHEPMLGGGALFFELAPERAFLNDYNEDLINTYTVVRDNPDSLIKCMRKMENSEEEYLRIRSSSPRSPINKAARFIYLNKLSFNGLYRVNASGNFNVPYCKVDTRSPLDELAIREASLTLQGASLSSVDYLEALTKVQEDDLVFIDPPYDDTFSNYTSNGFNKANHLALKEAFDYLTDLGAYAIVCNSDTPFVRGLYKNYPKVNISDRFVISAKGSSRSPKETFFITNFEF